MKTKLLTQQEFDGLLEYSTTVPTGNAIGKTWKRHNYIFKNKNGAIFNAGWLPGDVEIIEDRWFFCEYVPCQNKEGWVEVEMSLIEIVRPLEVDKLLHKFFHRSHAAATPSGP